MSTSTANEIYEVLTEYRSKAELRPLTAQTRSLANEIRTFNINAAAIRPGRGIGRVGAPSGGNLLTDSVMMGSIVAALSRGAQSASNIGRTVRRRPQPSTPRPPPNTSGGSSGSTLRPPTPPPRPPPTPTTPNIPKQGQHAGLSTLVMNKSMADIARKINDYNQKLASIIEGNLKQSTINRYRSQVKTAPKDIADRISDLQRAAVNPRISSQVKNIEEINRFIEEVGKSLEFDGAGNVMVKGGDLGRPVPFDTSPGTGLAEVIQNTLIKRRGGR